MKRVITIIIIAGILAGICPATGHAASDFTHKTVKQGDKYVTRFYAGGECVGKVVTGKRLKVKTVKSEKLTAGQLESRKDKYILVEVITGKCTNSKGDGKTSDGYYISYKRVKGHKKGTRYTTYCVYANNGYIDDIVIRSDFRG